MNTRKLLKNHLIKLGFTQFKYNKDYNKWAQEKIKKSKLSKKVIEKYYYYLKQNSIKNKYKLDLNFYNLIAEFDVLYKTLHSFKFKDIVLSGMEITKELTEPTKVLDIGCNIGYLTSFYAKYFPRSNFIGYDKSRYSIDEAKKIYSKLEYPNLDFINNLKKLNNNRFNYIIDTQCLTNVSNRNLRLIVKFIKNKLKPLGKVISISNLPNEKEAEKFIEIFYDNKLFLKEIRPLLLINLNGLQAYTKLIFTGNIGIVDYNLESYFFELRKKMLY